MIVASEDFYCETPPERIIGTECEYMVANCIPNKKQMLRVAAELGLAPSNIAENFIMTGGRLYIDTGFHTEYATPEALGPWHAAAADHAGQGIIQQVNDHVNSKIPEPIRRPALRRSASIDRETGVVSSRGYHENFLVPFKPGERRMQLAGRLLVSHVTTRPIWNGNGFVAGKYLLSQKASDTTKDITYTKQSIEKACVRINTDYQRYPDGFCIAEIRNADPHMSPTATFLSLAASSLLLRLVEHGKINPRNAINYLMDFPASHIGRVNATLPPDLYGITLQNGKKETPLSYQRIIAELTNELALEVQLPEDEVTAAGLWLDRIDRLERIKDFPEDITHIVKQIEWAAKYELLRRYLARKGNYASTMYSNPPAHEFDNKWHAVGSQYPGTRFWQTHDPNFEAMLPLIEKYRSEPPPTRAAARVALMESMHGMLKPYWHVVRTNGNLNYVQGLLTDPYDSEVPALTHVISRKTAASYADM